MKSKSVFTIYFRKVVLGAIQRRIQSDHRNAYTALRVIQIELITGSVLDCCLYDYENDLFLISIPIALSKRLR